VKQSFDTNIAIAAHQVDREKSYWLQKLSGELIRSHFMGDDTPNVLSDSLRDTLQFTFPQAISKMLTELSNASSQRLHMILTAGLMTLLYKYTGNEDIIIGTPVYRRKNQGKYLNTILPLRNRVNGEMSFKDLLLEVRQTMIEANQHQNYPFELLPDLLNLPISNHENPFFDTMVLLQNLHDKKDIEGSHCNTIFTFSDTQGRIEGSLEYNSALYEKSSIAGIVCGLTNIFQQVLPNSDIKLAMVTTLSVEERNQVLFDFNLTRREYPKDRTIQQLFEEQVRKTPDAIAAVCENRQLTYRQLNAKANRLAQILRNKGVKRNEIIGLMTEHSLETLIGILGVLKASGAYLPIDVEYPRDRVLLMLNDCKTRILLTTEPANGNDPSHLIEDYLASKLEVNTANSDHGATPGEEIKREVLFLEQLTQGKPDDEASENPSPENQPNDLAYLIYTSGSTGIPKGVMVTHQGLVNYIWWANQVYVNGELLSFSLYSSLSFDLTVTSIFTPLISGGKLVVYHDRDRISLITRIIHEDQTDIIKLTPTHLKIIGELDVSQSHLKKMIVGGEDLKTDLASKIYHKFNNRIQIFNEYGPTETVVGCMIYQYDPQNRRNSVPIGVPADNVQIYVLDKYLNPVARGAVGEIYISGDGVSIGYFNQPELTAAKFLPNPFVKGARMYRTGDLARFLADGTIEFLGRVDSQVKIRGYRVELGEIEAQLLKHEWIKEVVTLVKEEKTAAGISKCICAYFIADAQMSKSELREFLLDKVPDYMVPQYFIQVEKIPLTPNGKVDHKALLLLEDTGGATEYRAPENEIEERLVEIWQEVLGVKRLGTHERFFELGGDSIKAIQIASRLSRYQLVMEVQDILRNPTIKELHDDLRYVAKQVDQAAVEGKIELTPVQKWFLEKNFPDRRHFNQSLMLYSREGFHENSARHVFQKLLNHHDALRMVYLNEGSSIVQWNQPVAENVDLQTVDLRNNPQYLEIMKARNNQSQASLDLQNGPLIKLVLYQTDCGDYLLVVIHHLVFDGVSWRILAEDFVIAYNQAVRHQELQFQAKTHSYKEWSEKLRIYANSKELLRELPYWEKIEKTRVSLLPQDYPITRRLQNDCNTLTMILAPAQTAQLLREINRAYHTEINDILLTALGLAVRAWTGSEKVLINLEGHGREKIIEGLDITRTIGWFTSMYPVILELQKAEDLSHHLKKTKESLRKVPNKGIGYGILKYLTANEHKGTLQFYLAPQINFNYLGEFDRELKGSGFVVSDLPVGEVVSPDFEREYSLNITGEIIKGELNIHIEYNRNEYQEQTITRLLDDYQTNLLKIIEHCLQKAESELTPTDLGYSDLSFEELQVIMNNVNSL
jgi:amino acid adenylation domain-containing protein/non-ribosomal peptide synthase protein (TIGR01720 family)